MGLVKKIVTAGIVAKAVDLARKPENRAKLERVINNLKRDRG